MAALVGACLRFGNLGGTPPALNQDEAVNGYDAFSLWLTGRDHLGHLFPVFGLESFGDWVSPLLTFLTAPAVGLLGLRVDVVRGVPALIGTLAIPIMYLLGVELFRRKSVGILAAWLIALSPWHVHRGHFAIPPSIVPTLVALTMLCVIWAVHRGGYRRVLVATVVVMLTMASYPTMKLYIPLLLLAAGCIYGKAILRLPRAALAGAAAMLVVFTGPIYLMSLSDAAGRSRLDQVSIFADGLPGPGVLLHQYLTYLSPRILFVTGNGHPAQTPMPWGMGIEPLAEAPLLVVGLIWLAVSAVRPKTMRGRQAALFALAALVLYPIPGSLTIPSPHFGRGVQLIPLIALIGAVGLVALFRLVGHASKFRWWLAAPLGAAIVVGVGLFGAELVDRYTLYFGSYGLREDVLQYFGYGVEPALTFARSHEADYDEIWLANTNEAYIYVLFYGQSSPDLVQRQLRVGRQPPDFNTVDVWEKYHFGDWSILEPKPLDLIDTIVDPAGKPAYEIRGGVAQDGRRILFIHWPPDRISAFPEA